MRVNCYELLLVDEYDNNICDEVIINHQHYARINYKSNLEFIVKVNVYKDMKTNQYPCKYIRVGLYIDGIDVAYWKRIDTTADNTISLSCNYITARFLGFKKNVNDIRSFLFTIPRQDTSTKSMNDEQSKPLGSIHVVFFEAQIEGGIYENNIGCSEVPNEDSHVLNADTKFFEQASLATVGGRSIESGKEPFRPLSRWSNTSTEPLFDMTLYYHSKDILNVIQLANSENTRSSNKSSQILDLTEGNDSITQSSDNMDDLTVAVDSNDKFEKSDDEIIVLPRPKRLLEVLDLTTENTIKISKTFM